MPRAKHVRRSLRAAGRGPSGGFEGSGLHKLLVVLLAIKVFLLVVAFDPFGQQGFEFTKAQLGRMLMWPTAAGLLLAALRYGPSVIPRHRLHGFVAAFLLAAGLAAVFADVPYVAAYGERGNYFGLTFLLDMTSVYLCAAVALRRVSDYVTVGIGLIAAFAVALAYSVIQFVGLDPIRWPVDTRRPISTFGSTVRHSHFLVIVFSMALAVVVLAPAGRWRRSLRVGGIVIAATSLIVAGTVGSRAFFLGLVGGAVALTVLISLSGRLSRVRQVQLGAGVLVLGTLAVAFLITTPAGQRAGARVVELAAEERLLIYQSGLAALSARPLTGFGPDSFSPAYTRYRAPSTVALGVEVIENSAHNWALQTAVTTGVLGLVSLVALLGAWSHTVTRAMWRQPMLAGAIGAGAAAYWSQGLVSVGSNAIDWFPWLALGATVAIDATSDPQGTRPRAVPGWLSVAILSLAMLIGLTVIPALGASRAAYAAARGYAARDVAPAETASRAAVRGDPGRADHWNWLGLALTLRQDWPGSGDAFEEAARRAPYDSTYWHNLARSRTAEFLSSGQTGPGRSEALAAGRRGIDVEPSNAMSYILLSEISLSLGDPIGSIDVAAEGLARGVSIPEDMILRAASFSEDQAATRRALENVLRFRDSTPLRIFIARLVLSSGDREAAREHARKVLEREPTNEDALNILKATGG